VGREIKPHGKNGIYWKTLPPRADQPFKQFRSFRTLHRISHVSQFFALFRAFSQQDKKPINTPACLLCRMKIHDPFDVGIQTFPHKTYILFFRITTKNQGFSKCSALRETKIFHKKIFETVPCFSAVGDVDIDTLTHFRVFSPELFALFW